MTNEIQTKTINLEQLTSDHSVLNLHHNLLKEELRVKTLKCDDFETKYTAKAKIEKKLTIELEELNKVHEKLKIESKLKYEDTFNKKITIETELQKIQKEFSQLNEKYVAEVRNGMEKFQNATEDRNELNFNFEDGFNSP